MERNSLQKLSQNLPEVFSGNNSNCLTKCLKNEPTVRVKQFGNQMLGGVTCNIIRIQRWRGLLEA